ncbi:hypothetical protein J4P90_12770 [Bacillus sp. SY8(2021)]|uniref:Uncharacterized protein n=1 Tax=Bacillus arachidis TaxID=2819290 RepID=A0ABS3NYS7_9BACI|nr:hypothetical protein [Bacillus arachidis]
MFNYHEDKLKTGIHTVTAVQFEGGEPTGKVLNFTEAKFEIKEKNNKKALFFVLG